MNSAEMIKKEKQREYSRKYRETHKEQLLEYQRKWREEHREQVYESTRKYRQALHVPAETDYTNRLRLLISFAGSMEKFAQRMGVTKQAVSMYLKTKKPTIGLLCKISNEFDVSVDWLLGRTNEETEATKYARSKRISEIDNEIAALNKEVAALEEEKRMLMVKEEEA